VSSGAGVVSFLSNSFRPSTVSVSPAQSDVEKVPINRDHRETLINFASRFNEIRFPSFSILHPLRIHQVCRTSEGHAVFTWLEDNWGEGRDTLEPLH